MSRGSSSEIDGHRCVKTVDELPEGIDLAVRYMPVEGAQGERLFGEELVPVCSPALLRRKSHPLAAPADLVHHTLLHVADPGSASMPLEWEPWLQQLGQPKLQPQARLTFNSYNEAIAAALLEATHVDQAGQCLQRLGRQRHGVVGDQVGLPPRRQRPAARLRCKTGRRPCCRPARCRPTRRRRWPRSCWRVT